MSEILIGKSVLIVAKKLDVLGNLRAFYSGLGATDISVASSANMAINMLRMRSYAFCILESDLGENEKSGAQVIEEAGREGIRPATSAFLLLMPESVSQLPRDSIEYAADTFVSKPLDLAKLNVRMEKLVKLKQAVYPVEAAIDAGEHEKALKLIRKLTSKYASLELYLDRLKGQLLLKMDALDEALQHFQRVAEDRKLDWAYLGQGICNFRQGHYAEALSHFNRVLQHEPSSIEAYEWLSKVYRCIGQNQEAQSLLEKAVKMMPTAASVQSGLGNVASENNSWEVAIDAFRSAVKYARHSCHQHQNNYFGLARCLQTRLSSAKTDQSSAAQEEAVRTLEDVAQEYFEDDHIRFKSRLMTSETYKRSGDIARANSAAKHAFEAYQQLSDDKKAEELDNLLEGVEGTSMQDAVDEFKNDFNRRVYTETEWGRNNLKGMGLYRKGLFYEAFGCFEKALSDVEGSPSILLNLVQAGHEVIKREPERAPEILSICNDRLLKISIGALNSKQQERYRALSERRAELVAKNGQ
ncbi:MAG: tetratricopeptide repeat protein [Motiliproteus sp.]|nr:tetratricopeptide repeat protein [Motiliproteus sp.]MCW9054311.1 tetratricopeptide repeat protein [Motiliproteus sp.]